MVATEEYHSTSSHNTSISFDLLPEGPDKETVAEMRDELTKKAGGENWMLRQRLNGIVGTTAAALLANLIHWSGRGHAPGGWVWKTREEIADPIEGTGQLNGEFQMARKILRGDRKWNKQTFHLVEECRPSRRRPTFYRVDLVAVADLIGVELLSAIEDDFDFFDLEESESSLETTQNGQPSHKHPESSLETTESSLEATESSLETSSVDTSVGTFSSSTLQVGAEPAKAEPAPAVRDEVEEVVAPAKPDDDALLAEVKEILDAESGRWSYACYIRNDYAPEKVAGYIITNAEDIKRPEVVTSAARDELVQAVEYVQWEAVA
jgi:hypothetical protein